MVKKIPEKDLIKHFADLNRLVLPKKESFQLGIMDENPQEKDTKPPTENSGDTGYFQAGTMTGDLDCFAMDSEKGVFPARIPRQVSWSVVWSDIMMTMFIMFAVLYIYQAANRDFRYGESAKTQSPKTMDEKTKPPPEKTNPLIEEKNPPPEEKKQTPDELSELKLEMMKSIEEPMEKVRLETLKNMDQIKLMEDKAVRIVLPADLLFDMGRAELKSQAESSLREIAEAIRRTDDMINVVGHTDDVPIHSEQFATNWELSAIRACTVTRFLIERMNISAERFYISGYSYFQPLKANIDLKNRAENRRVEIILTKKKPVGTEPRE